MLPSAGPTARDVREESKQQEAVLPGFALIPVDDQVISVLRRRAADTSLSSFGDRRASGDYKVGVGDAVTVTIWEAGSGGLFSAPAVREGQIPGSRQATIPEQIVGRDGAITVPYAGRVQVAGRHTSEIERSIEQTLDGKAIQPQVLVTITRPLSNTVTVVGEGAAGARIPLSPKGDRILDILASAGGNRVDVNESFIQLTRDSRTARVAMTKVAADPRENIYLRPGDVLTVIRDPQIFFAVGAVGRNAEIPFNAEGITLGQAIAKAGGLLDFRADPDGVFVFRLEKPEIARALTEVTPEMMTMGGVRVAYAFNMRETSGIFAASQFRIFNRDVIFVSNAILSDVQKVAQLFNMITSPVAQGASIANAVQ
ncbi:polysaccharide biosynthesis/export family protein [Bosea sp. 117]|uniref:polysaccharide biosynthesis/export family protein n=1 Tax=Bosea sp. 117 TaxID=1125973 RepID=UPI0020C152BF|nr:polysaccharide biosynthesis/export family protein [Bosea sp. 117]